MPIEILVAPIDKMGRKTPASLIERCVERHRLAQSKVYMGRKTPTGAIERMGLVGPIERRGRKTPIDRTTLVIDREQKETERV